MNWGFSDFLSREKRKIGKEWRGGGMNGSGNEECGSRRYTGLAVLNIGSVK